MERSHTVGLVVCISSDNYAYILIMAKGPKELKVMWSVF